MTPLLADIPLVQGDHVVQFYERDAELAHNIGRYLVDGLRAGAAAIVIATEAHREAFLTEIAAAGLDPLQQRDDGGLVLLDAAETVAMFIRDGQVDRDAFRRVIGPVVGDAGNGRRPVLAYGEMVALLWEEGNVVGAIDLEEAWNELSLEFSFTLVCGYSSESVTTDGLAEALEQVCHLHSSVVNPPVSHRPSVDPAGAQASADFDPEFSAPRAARRFVTEVLDGWGHRGSLLEDARLLATELATNAVLHARSPFSVSVRRHGSGVRLSVDDASHVRPTLREPRGLESSGRGLQLVAAIAARWGVDLTDDGKTVWAELRPGVR